MANNPVNSTGTSNMGALTTKHVNVRLGVVPVLLLLVFCSSAPQDIVQLEDKKIFYSEIHQGVYFASDSGSIFGIDPDSSIGINVNFSSNLDNESNVILSIDGPSGWDISWDSQDSPEAGREYAVTPDQIYWVHFSITSPPVFEGLPLSNSLHEVSMSIASDQGEILDWYNFSMRYGYYEGVEIVQGGGVSSIIPGGVLTLETIVRNTGNSIRSFDVEIVALDENGSMITAPGDYFETDNWSASIIERWRVSDLPPNSTGAVKVQIFSPGGVEGALYFEILVSSSESPESISSATHIVNIVPRIGGTISISEDGCSMVKVVPGGYCEMEVTITNTGDGDLDFSLDVLGLPEWATVDYRNDIFSLQPGSSSESMTISCSVTEGASSDLFAEVTISMIIDDWSPGYVNFNLNSGTIYSWKMEMSYQLKEDDNITAIWTMTNLGNGVDGFTASIDSSILTDFGITISESFPSINVSESSRYLEIYPVNKNDSVDIIGWMQVPESAPTETMANLTLETRSFLEPSIFFIDSIPVIIQGESLPEDGEQALAEDWIIPLLNNWLEPIMIMAVVVVGIYGVMWALKIGNPREDEQTITEGDDWLAKFVRKSSPITEIIESPKINIEEFERDFFGGEGRPESEVFDLVDEKIVNEAGDLLDRSKEDSDIEEAFRIADKLGEQDILHPDNEILDIDDKGLVSEENISDNQVPSDFDLEI